MNIWFKKQICTRWSNDRSSSVRQVTLVFIWTFVDKIKSQSRFLFKHARNIILFSSSSFVSKRIFISSIDRHCKEIHWLWLRYLSDHDWRWKFQSRCDRREETNSKAKDAKTKTENICESCENENLVENLDREDICRLVWWNDRFLRKNKNRDRKATSISQTYAVSNFSNLSFSNSY